MASSPDQVKPILAQGWTLNYEMFFYCIFAVVLFLDRRKGIIALTVIFLILVAAGASMKPLWDTRAPTNPFEFWTDPIILAFLAGALLSLLRPALAAASPERSALTLTLLATLMLAATAITVVYGSSELPRPAASQWSIRFACIVAVLICLIPHRFPAGMVGRALYLLGNASFSTYLIHSFAIRWGLIAMSWIPGDATIVKLALLLVFANVFGLAVHLIVEIPLLRFMSPHGRLTNAFVAILRPWRASGKAGGS